MSLGISFHEDARTEFDLYSVVDAQIRVLAVAHDRRRPYYWIGRS